MSDMRRLAGGIWAETRYFEPCEECDQRPAILECDPCKLLICSECVSKHLVDEHPVHLEYPIRDRVGWNTLDF